MRQLYRAQSPVEAHLLKAALAADGIAAIVRDENMFALSGGGPTLWVSEQDFDAARQVVEAEWKIREDER